MKLISEVSGELYSKKIYEINPGYRMEVLCMNKRYFITVSSRLDIINQPIIMYDGKNIGIGFQNRSIDRYAFEEYFDYVIHAMMEIKEYIEEYIEGWEIL